eukprot:gene1280-2468_t
MVTARTSQLWISSLLVTALFFLSTAMKLNLNQVYTLKSGAEIDASYVVGPKQLRRMVQNRARKKSMELDELRRLHKDLDKQIALIDIPKRIFMHAELKKLKAEKLYIKDQIMQIMKLHENETDKTGILELGSGGFGKVLFGHCIQTGKETAIKVASVDDFAGLWKEYLVLQRLNEPGFPKVFYFGKQEILGMGPHVVMVMDVLGPSLEKLLFATMLGVKGFSSNTVLRIALQLLCRLESLSIFNIVHGDIQPGNFLMGKDDIDKDTVHLIDFGLCTIPSIQSKKFPGQLSGSAFRGAFNDDDHINDNNGNGIDNEQNLYDSLHSNPITTNGDTRSNSNSNNNKLTTRILTNKLSKTDGDTIQGTLGFASSRILRGEKAQERDDLESLAFSLAYLLQGRLPWSNIELELETNDINKYTGLTTEMKISTMIQEMASRQDAIKPTELCGDLKDEKAALLIADILEHARSIEYDAKPDYSMLKAKAMQALTTVSPLIKYDWGNEGISWSPIDGSLKYEYYG